MEYGLSIWDMMYRYDYLPYRYGYPGCQYGIWANNMGGDSIDTVISHIDMGHILTLLSMTLRSGRGRDSGGQRRRGRGQGPILVHFSDQRYTLLLECAGLVHFRAQPEPFWSLSDQRHPNEESRKEKNAAGMGI